MAKSVVFLRLGVDRVLEDVRTSPSLNRAASAALIQAPESLAYVLEAAGSVTLERCILDERARLPE